MTMYTDYDSIQKFEQQRRDAIMQRAAKEQLAQSVRAGEGSGQSFYSPALAKLGTVLSNVGEGLQTRHGGRSATRAAGKPIYSA
jgi:hypothetical protein